MLVCLGYDVAVQFPDGSQMETGRDLLYDASGNFWPKTSLLIASFARENRPHKKMSGFARKWFGSAYEGREGSVALPPRELDGWRDEGSAARIFYVRTDDDLEREHAFAGGLFGVSALSFSKRPRCYSRRGALRLECGRELTINHRGIVAP